MFSPKNNKSSYIVKHSDKHTVNKKNISNTQIEHKTKKNENEKVFNKKNCNCCIIN